MIDWRYIHVQMVLLFSLFWVFFLSINWFDQMCRHFVHVGFFFDFLSFGSVRALSFSLSLPLSPSTLCIFLFRTDYAPVSVPPILQGFDATHTPKPQMFADINGLLSNASDFLSIPLTFAFAFIRQRKSGLTRAPIWKFGLLFNASPLPSPNLGDSGSGSGLMSFLSTHTGLNYVYIRRKTSCRDW